MKAVIPFAMALLLPAAAVATPTPAPVRQQPVAQLPKWDDFSRRQTTSLNALNACEMTKAACTSKEIERWAGLIGQLKGQNQLRQIITVNRWFNRQPYKYDEYAYNTLDYWADTNELLSKRGDCEDFALSKYYTLRQLGFTPEQLQVAVVYDTETYTNHAVLMVYLGQSRFMLDINADDTSPSPMDYRYKTIYAFNEMTAWFY